MTLEPRFTDDLADLPTHKFGPSSLTWWGIIGYMIVEGGFFAMAFAAYFYLMGHEQGWPPEGRVAPNLLWGMLFLHTLHILTDWGDTIVLSALMMTPLGYEGRRLVDTDENALYWRYVWLLWLPIYVMI